MNLYTRALMVISTGFTALLGLGALFLPQEALSYAGYPAEGFAVVLVQVTGALYLGFSLINWMTRAAIIGGIYSRPVVVGNFMHFAIVTITFVKSLTAQAPLLILIVAAVYALLAVWFGAALFTHPTTSRESGR